MTAFSFSQILTLCKTDVPLTTRILMLVKKIISFSRKSNALTFVLYNSGITLIDCIEDLGVFLDYKL
jgi:hypothetical protein